MSASVMKRIWCHSFQGVLKLGNYFLGYRTPEYLQKPGAVKELPQTILSRGIRHVLFVTDEGLMKIGLPKSFMEAMDEAGLSYTVFSHIQPNPTDENVEEGFRVFRESGCDAIVAFGGGSPMDCAKAIAAKNAHPKKTVRQLQGILKVHKKIVPFFAIPTTAGTGSETTVAAVITEAATHHKASINDPAITPTYALLDPELTAGLPSAITATTGMDALCHAVESYINWTYLTALEKDYSKKAVKLIHDNILRVYEDGSDIDARSAMQLAAFYAGRSFTRGCVGYVHAIGHTLGGLYGLPHGLAMSIILPHVLRAFGPAAERKLSELADICGMGVGTEHERAERFISWIEEMKEKMQIPKGYQGFRDEDIPTIIRWAEKEANPLYPVPVIWGEEEFRNLIETVRKA